MPFWSTRFRFIRGNLIFKILFVVVFTTVVAVVILLAYSTIITRKAVLDYAQSIHEVRLQNSTTIVDQKLYNLQSDIAGLAAAYTVNNVLSSPNLQNQSQLKKDLQTTFKNIGPWRQIFIADVNKNVVEAIGQNPNQSVPLQATDEYLEFRRLIEENKSISATTSKDHKAIVNYLQPVKSSTNKVIGYVGGIYDLENLKQLINIPQENAIYIVNKEGQASLVLGNNNLANIDDINRVTNQEQIPGEPTAVEQNNQQTTYLPEFNAGLIAQLQLRLVGVLDQQFILKDIDEFRNRVYIMSVIALVIVNILLILYLNRLVIKPLNELREVAQKIAAGEYGARAPISRRTDAIGLLQYALNDMAMTLINEHSNLQTKVNLQTRELSDKIHDLEKAKTATVNILEDLEIAKTEIEKTKNTDEALLTSIGDGVIATDEKANVIFVNTAAQKLLGFNVKEVVGNNFFDMIKMYHDNDELVPKTQRPIYTALRKHTTTTTTYGQRSVYYYQRKNKTKFPTAVKITPVFQRGRLRGTVSVFRDITKELQAEMAKTEFVSLASHQLKTPLTAISWYSEILLKDKSRSLKTTQKRYLEEISTGNRRMVELVNALLNVSRLELGTVAISPQKTEPAKIIPTIITEFSQDIKRHKLKLRLDIAKNLPTIKSDPQLLRIIIQNLVSNSVKYTPSNGKIQVTVKNITKPTIAGNKQLKENRVLISVKDSGYGIPPKDQDKIFNKLFRADNVKTKDTDGTGLGLYLAKLLASKLKCKLWFTSKGNQGTTFYLAVPIDAPIEKAGTRELEQTNLLA